MRIARIVDELSAKCDISAYNAVGGWNARPQTKNHLSIDQQRFYFDTDQLMILNTIDGIRSATTQQAVIKPSHMFNLMQIFLQNLFEIARQPELQYYEMSRKIT